MAHATVKMCLNWYNNLQVIVYIFAPWLVTSNQTGCSIGGEISLICRVNKYLFTYKFFFTRPLQPFNWQINGTIVNTFYQYMTMVQVGYITLCRFLCICDLIASGLRPSVCKSHVETSTS